MLTKHYKNKSRRVVDTIIDHSRCDAVLGGSRNDIAIETIVYLRYSEPMHTIRGQVELSGGNINKVCPMGTVTC